ncbi:hypothetical protein Tco_0236934 [Tanacetum coccineum]
MEPFYTRKTKISNRQVQLRDEHRGGLRSIEKGLKILWRNMKKKPSFPLFLSSSSSSNPSTLDSTQASSSNPSKKIKLTIIPPRQLFVNISSDEDVTTIPSPITTSSSPSLPNAPSKTPSTKDTSSTFGTTSSSFESKRLSSPPSSNDTPYPQPSNPFLENIMDAPLRHSHPLSLQNHPSLDITLSLSPIIPLDHILDTLSPPSPQLPTFMHHLHHHHNQFFFPLMLKLNFTQVFVIVASILETNSTP